AAQLAGDVAGATGISKGKLVFGVLLVLGVAALGAGALTQPPPAELLAVAVNGAPGGPARPPPPGVVARPGTGPLPPGAGGPHRRAGGSSRRASTARCASGISPPARNCTASRPSRRQPSSPASRPTALRWRRRSTAPLSAFWTSRSARSCGGSRDTRSRSPR